MPSFAKIFSVAALAFAAFTSALPTPDHGSVADVHDVNVANIHDNEVFDRSNCACAEPGVPSLVGILVDLQVDVKVEIDALTAITKDTCTVGHVKPIVVSLCAKIDAAAIKIGILGKYKLEQILFNGDAVVTVAGLAELICSLVIAILTAVGCVLRIIGNVKGDIYDLLCLVGYAVCRLLHCILAVVVDIVAELLIILCVKLQVIFWVCVRLCLIDLYAVLKINVSLFL